MYVFGTPAGLTKETAMSSYPLSRIARRPRADAFMLQADQARMASVARRRRRAARAAARAAVESNAASVRQTHGAARRMIGPRPGGSADNSIATRTIGRLVRQWTPTPAVGARSDAPGRITDQWSAASQSVPEPTETSSGTDSG